MKRLIKRLLTLGVLAGGGTVGWRLFRHRAATNQPLSASPQWPPFAETTAQPIVHNIVQNSPGSDSEAPARGADEHVAWVSPIDGGCPPGFPIKANNSSRIYHTPGGRSYQRTVAERCYATADAAERDGYRAAKF